MQTRDNSTRRRVNITLAGIPCGRELGIEPSKQTTDLYREISESRYRRAPSDESPAREPAEPFSAKSPSPLSIAVLPFVNMSGDIEQDYFSDGITEDILTDLSRVSALFVIARNTAFTLQGAGPWRPSRSRGSSMSNTFSSAAFARSELGFASSRN